VIQIVRHPGAVLWSYFRYLVDVLPASDYHRFFSGAPTLDAVIKGEAGYAHWSVYHNSWNAIAASLPGRYVLLKYEEVVADQAGARARLADFLSVSESSDAPAEFDKYRRRKLGWDVRGTSLKYEQFFSRRQLELLWDSHGETAARFGYTPPDLALASPDEQVRRLSEMLEGAWTHARMLELQPARKMQRKLARLVRTARFHQQ
jgi:hypothetical protein